MTLPRVDSLPPSDPAEDAFVELLAAWDERLASGKSTQLPEHTPEASGLQERLEKAQSCLKLLNQLWPKPQEPAAPGDVHLAYARFGRYEIIRELGRGGHGVVFLAADPSLKRQVALKVPRPSVLSDDGLRMRFLREAEATARLDHSNILPIYEVGCEGPICYTAAAYCDGGTLQDWISRGNAPCAPRQAAEIVAELAEAIHHAHTRGILHRDLKPSNVLLSRRASAERGVPNAQCGMPTGRDSAIRNPPSSDRLLDDWVPKIADFGLAKVIDGPQDSTMHGVVMGTANYMAPEQAEGRNADVGVTSDVYSLGVILYELLSGAPPLVSPSRLMSPQNGSGDEAAWPSTIRRRVPSDLRTICLTCLQTDQKRRYQTAAALADDLQRFLRGESVTARPQSLPQRLWRTIKRHPALSLLAAAAVGLAIGFVVQLFVHNRELTGKNAELARLIRKEREQARSNEELRQLAERQNAELAERIASERKQARSNDELRKLAERQAEENLRRSYGAKLRVVQQFADAGNLRQMTEVLHETFPENEQAIDVREFAWRYWWQRCRRAEVFHLPGHGKYVHDAQMSPDGAWIATASDDGTVRVWDFATGREQKRLYVAEGKANRVTFSPEGTMLAAAGEPGRIKIWRTSDWRLSASLRAHGETIPGLVFASEETLISGGEDGWLKAWNPATGEVQHQYELAHGRYVSCLAVARRSKLLLVGVHNGEIQLRSTEDVGHRIGMMKGHGENVMSIAVSLQEDQAFSRDLRGDLRLWDLASRSSTPRIDDGAAYIHSPTAISPDGRILAAAAAGGRLQVFDNQTGRLLHERAAGIESVSSLAFSRNGDAILAAGSDGQVVLWQPFDRRPEQPAGHDKELWSVAFAPGGQTFVTGSDDETVREWSTVSGELLREVLVQSGTVASATYSPDGSLLLATSLEEEEPRVSLWKMPEGTLWKSLHGHFGKVYSAAYHPRDNVVATGSREVIVWDVMTGEKVGLLDDSQQTDKKVKSIAFSQDGSRLAFASEDGNVYLYSYPELKRLRALECGGEAWAVAFSPDGQSLAAGNRDGSVTIWNPHTGAVRYALNGHLQGVLSVAYSHDGQTIATGSEDKTIKLWGPHTGQELCTLRGHESVVRIVRFSPDDQWLSSGSHDGTLRLWHAPQLSTFPSGSSGAALEQVP